MKEFAAALPLCREALQIRESILGKRHLEVAEIYVCLENSNTQVGNHRAAKSLLIRALEIDAWHSWLNRSLPPIL